jgi:hypothetical protein
MTNADTGDLTVVERLRLLNHLSDVNSRLGSIEEALVAPRRTSSSVGSWLPDVSKVLVSWPAFALLFLFLFCTPIRKALDAIPAKIDDASEIAVGSFTLKSTISRVARSRGMSGIGATIPELSEDALRLLIRAPRNPEGLISYTVSQDGQTRSSFRIPTDSTQGAIAELIRRGFVHVEGDISGNASVRTLDGNGLRRLVAAITRQYPGARSPNQHEGRVEWELKTRMGRNAPMPALLWRLTDQGVAAVNIVISAVAQELARSGDGVTEPATARGGGR